MRVCAEHADFDGIENLALVLGGEITSTFDDPSTAKLGSCKLIEEIMIGGLGARCYWWVGYYWWVGCEILLDAV